jgi:toxin ParE1/3/4
MITWAPEAIGDLTEAWNYIAADNPQAATRIVDTIRAKAEYLSRFPNLGRPGPTKNSRLLVVVGTSYIIVYRIAGPNIEIARVIHSARDWPPKRKRP